MRRALLVLPALALLAGIFLLPILEAGRLSLFRLWRQVPGEAPFVGLDNYRRILGEERFWTALVNTLTFTAASVAAELLLGFGIALLLHAAFRGRGLVRSAALVPWALPTVVATLMWAWIFHDRYGIANHALLSLGLLDAPRVWLGEPGLAMAAAVAADVWKTTPYVALILLAGLQAIPPEVYEAGRLDGARRWQLTLHLTLPLLQPALLVALLFRSLDAFRVFDLIYVLTRGGPGGATETLAVYTYLTLFQDLDVGKGSALGVLVFLVAMGISAVYLWALRARLTGP